MLRTWLVRLLAIELTLSVKSFQVPATAGTKAWPPSLPSVPTSRATRVTSAAKASSCFTMALTVLAAARNWPWRGRPSASSATVWVKSPWATAPITRAMSVVGRTRSSIRPLIASMLAFQAPPCSPTDTRSASRPFLPTASLTRRISRVRDACCSMMPFSSSAILPCRPVQSSGRRTEKSPRFMAFNTVSNCFMSDVLVSVPRARRMVPGIGPPAKLGWIDGQSGKGPRECRETGECPILGRSLAEWKATVNDKVEVQCEMNWKSHTFRIHGP